MRSSFNIFKVFITKQLDKFRSILKEKNKSTFKKSPIKTPGHYTQITLSHEHNENTIFLIYNNSVYL